MDSGAAAETRTLTGAELCRAAGVHPGYAEYAETIARLPPKELFERVAKRLVQDGFSDGGMVMHTVDDSLLAAALRAQAPA